MFKLFNDPHEHGTATRGVLPPIGHDRPVLAQGRQLVRIDRLGDRGVVEVLTPDDGVLAVGLTPDKTPFAVSNICRHQFGGLGRGRVTPSGCLECPWHRARYDVTEGTMVEGPKGRVFGFRPYSFVVKSVANRLRLKVHPVELREGAIWLRH